jgi:hypothetical protein
MFNLSNSPYVGHNKGRDEFDSMQKKIVGMKKMFNIQCSMFNAQVLIQWTYLNIEH